MDQVIEEMDVKKVKKSSSSKEPKKKKKKDKKKSKKKKKKKSVKKENEEPNIESKQNLNPNTEKELSVKVEQPPSPNEQCQEEKNGPSRASSKEPSKKKEEPEPEPEQFKSLDEFIPYEKKQFDSLMNWKSSYKRDCTKNISWFDTQDELTKIKLRIVIPDYIGPHLQRKDNLLGRIESRYNCKLAFVADTETRVSTCEGIKGQLVQFAGKLPEVLSAMQSLLKEIIITEQELNGKRKS